MNLSRGYPNTVLVLLLSSVLLALSGCGADSSISITGTQATKKFMLVADTHNNRVLIFDGPLGTGQSAITVLGQVDFTSLAEATTATGLITPASTTMDAQGNIWVSDENNNRVLQYTPPFSNGMAASLVLGQMDFTSSASSTTPNGFSLPNGLAFDKNGNLWVADTYNNRVVEFTPPFSNGMSSSLVLGQTDLNFNCIATVSRLCYPTNLAFDAKGDLWVVDTDNNRVVEYAPPFATGESATTVLGQTDFTGRTEGTGAAGLNEPWGIAVDKAGNVWLSDGTNFRVLEFSPPFSNGQAANLVLGFQNFTATVNSNLESSLSNPRGVTFDSEGNLFVVDLGDSRVLEFVPPFSNGMNASLVIGQPNLNSQGATITPSASGLANPLGVSTSF